MTNGSAAGGAAAAAGAAIAQAIKASGAIVRVGSSDFEILLNKTDKPLVVYSESRFFSTKYHYLTAYKGLIFYTKTTTPLMLRLSAEVIRARQIWIPG